MTDNLPTEWRATSGYESVEQRLDHIEAVLARIEQELKRLQPVVLVSTTTTVPPTVSFGPTVSWANPPKDKP